MFFLLRVTALTSFLLAGLRIRRSHDLPLVHVGVPDVQGAHLGELGHRLAVGGNRGHRDRLGVRLPEPIVLRGDHEARGHPLDVVLERARQRLVEVVQIEQQPPFGRSERTEVRQVGVPAQLDGQSRPRGVLQVDGHDLGGTAVEGEWRDHHPTMAHRDEVRFTRLVLLLQQDDRVRTVGGGFPTLVARQGDLVAGLLAVGEALVDRRGRDSRGDHDVTSCVRLDGASGDAARLGSASCRPPTVAASKRSDRRSRPGGRRDRRRRATHRCARIITSPNGNPRRARGHHPRGMVAVGGRGGKNSSPPTNNWPSISPGATTSWPHQRQHPHVRRSARGRGGRRRRPITALPCAPGTGGGRWPPGTWRKEHRIGYPRPDA